MKTKVALRLSSLTCVEESEGGSEPYLWPIMIAHESGTPRMHVPNSEWAAKVLAAGMTAGQSVPVPAGMDMNFVDVFDDKAAGLLVFVIALFEKDNLSNKARLAAFRHLEDESFAVVGEKLQECRQSSGERVDLTNVLIRRLDFDSAVKGALNLLEEGFYAALPGGYDDALGLMVWTFSGQTLSAKPVNFDIRQTSERFTLSGRLEVSVVLPPICEGERAAVAQAAAVVQGLRGQRASLQQQLQHATPQQKAGLIAAIKRINEVELPPAEAALEQAEAALSACLSARDIDGPVDDPIFDPVG